MLERYLRPRPVMKLESNYMSWEDGQGSYAIARYHEKMGAMLTEVNLVGIIPVHVLQSIEGWLNMKRG